MWERYRDDPKKYRSALHRLKALAKLAKDPRMKEWCRQSAEGVAVDNAVLSAAATVGLTWKGDFPFDKFTRAVEKFAGRS